MARYVALWVVTILRIFITYKPAPFFGILSLILGGGTDFDRSLSRSILSGEGHVQSLVLGASLVGLSAPLLLGEVIADLIATNRRLLEDIRVRILRQEVRLPQAMPTPMPNRSARGSAR